MTVDHIPTLVPGVEHDYVTLDELYRARLTRYLRRCFRGDAGVDVEEAVQETFCRAWERVAQLDPGRDPWPWLVVVARNVINDAKRRQARTRLQLVADVPSPTDRGPLEDIIASEDARALGDLIAELPASQRTVFKLRLVDHWSFADIAAFTDSTENCVRQQLHRARSHLAARWRGRESQQLGLVLLSGLTPLRALLRRASSARVLESVAGIAVAGTVAVSIGVAQYPGSAGQAAGAPRSGGVAVGGLHTQSVAAQSPLAGPKAAAPRHVVLVTHHASGQSAPAVTARLNNHPLAPGSEQDAGSQLPVGGWTAIVKFRDHNSDGSGGPLCRVSEACGP